MHGGAKQWARVAPRCMQTISVKATHSTAVDKMSLRVCGLTLGKAHTHSGQTKQVASCGIPVRVPLLLRSISRCMRAAPRECVPYALRSELRGATWVNAGLHGDEQAGKSYISLQTGCTAKRSDIRELCVANKVRGQTV